MPVNVGHKIVGEVVILYPEGSVKGIASGPVKTATEKHLADGYRKFIISFKNVISIDPPYSNAMNSIFKEVMRSDGKLILSDASKDILPYLEKNAPDIPIYKTEDIALTKLTGKSAEDLSQGKVGAAAVVGTSAFAGELFKGIDNYKGLIFHYFDDPASSAEKVVDLNPKVILLNLEFGTDVLQSIRRWRFEKATKECPIVLFGPPSQKSLAPLLMKEGASDFIEVRFDRGEVLAYLKPLDFRNVLARKLDMVLTGEYERLIDND